MRKRSWPLMVCMPYKDYGLVGDMTSVRPVYTVPSGANVDNLRGLSAYPGPDSLQGADLSEQEQEQEQDSSSF